ncbi:MAG: hypothetical protein EA389_08350 [Ilumatobacter sp.]|nr:MAG: hypothetical protein EA389_08350 [Ilumatobacter sp.]
MVWSRIKKAFDFGGVKRKLDLPPGFSWQDPVLPVAVRLTNSTDDERVVVKLSFTISESTSSQNSKDGKQKSAAPPTTFITYERPVEIRLAPGQEETVDVEIPLSVKGTLDAEDGEAPGWMSTAASALGTFQNMTRNDRNYTVAAGHTVEGFKPTGMSGRSIRHLRPGESAGSWTRHFG